MTREQKAEIIEDLVQKLNDTDFFYITDTSGLTVAQVNQFRKMCFNKGIEYKVVKNTLIKKALDRLETDYTSFDGEVLKGFSGIMFSPESGNAPAKIIKEFRKKGGNKEKPALKGASIDCELFIGDNNLNTLSELKSKNELVADVIALLQSPAKNVISALQSGKSTIAGVLKTLGDRPE